MSTTTRGRADFSGKRRFIEFWGAMPHVFVLVAGVAHGQSQPPVVAGTELDMDVAQDRACNLASFPSSHATEVAAFTDSSNLQKCAGETLQNSQKFVLAARQI